MSVNALLARSRRSWQEFERGRHSAKPEEVRGFIERASPGPYLELFGRRPVEGWAVFGNQVERAALQALGAVFLQESAADPPDEPLAWRPTRGREDERRLLWRVFPSSAVLASHRPGLARNR
jgi:hypothetical protein